MWREIYLNALRCQRRLAYVWVALVTVMSAATMLLWPFLRDRPELSQIQGQVPPEVMERVGLEDNGFASAAAFVHGSLFVQNLPYVLIAAALAGVIGLTVADEAAGRLEVLLALPVPRGSVFLGRSAAVGTIVGGLVLIALVVVAALDVVLGTELPLSGLVAAVLMVGLLALFHGGLAYALAGAGVGRGAVIGLAIGVGFGGMILSVVAPMLGPAEPVGYVSPWTWAVGTRPLLDGLDPVGVLVLSLATAALFAVGSVLVRRRDIAVAD